MKSDVDAAIRGALFDFMGFLTTREEPIEVGASHDATLLMDLFTEWAESRDLDINGPTDVEGWRDHLP